MLIFVVLFATQAFAAGAASLEVSPSATEISADENLSLEFKVVTDEYNARIERPEFTASDFDEINIYGTMTGVESAYVNGSISVRKTQTTTVVLHPKRQGSLKISNMHVNVNGKPVRAEDIVIDVKDSGSIPKFRSSVNPLNPRRSQLPNSGAHAQRGTTMFLKTEPSKLKAYKGEQIILSYALYTTVPIVDIQIERFPTVPGFLKEDIDIPSITHRLQFSKSVVGGREYDRALMAQYAIFPLKDGPLSIDAFTGKFTYRPQNQRRLMPGMDDDDDPMSMLGHFMNAMQAQTETRASDRVTIDVLPLPAAGQPANFSGLVGDFEITAVADKMSLKAGEQMNVKVKVEGKGHAGSLEHLNVAWPQDFELYEDKSNTTYQRTGRSERVFDYMLIPKTKGNFEIPAIELSMFNPDTARYQIKKTLPIKVEVLEGQPGQTYTPQTQASSQSSQAAEPKTDIRYWKDAVAQAKGAGFARILWMALIAAVGGLIFVWVRPILKKTSAAAQKRAAKAGKHLLTKAKALGGMDSNPADTLAKAEAILSELLTTRYGVSKGSLRRAEVREELAARRAPPDICEKVESLLERCENFRFVPGGAQPQAARDVVKELVELLDRVLT